MGPPRAALLLLLLVFPQVGAQDAGTTPTLRIVELLADPDTAAGQREFIEIVNLGDGTVALAGWTVTDLAGNRFTFPEWSLGAGRRVVVWGGGAADGLGPAWSMGTAWNNAGDTATLMDPAGGVVDWFSFGSSRSAAPPAGFTADGHPTAASKGQSMAFADGWAHAAPSPGLAPGATGGSATAVVANTAPVARIEAGPATASPGGSFTIAFSVEDANGEEDIATWRLTGNGADIVVGARGGSFVEQATAPAAGPWTLLLRATDGAGASSEDSVTIDVRASGLRLAMPDGGQLVFPPLVPGATNVTSSNVFTLSNDGEQGVRPLFDLSDFRGPGVLPVEGNAWIEFTSDGATTSVAYDGPLTPLPELPPGAVASVGLRIGQVPSPLLPGDYGTSFSVVG